MDERMDWRNISLQITQQTQLYARENYENISLF
jgi:hypothetical protein